MDEKLLGWATKFAFQEEQGDSGFIYWQVRLNLIHKKSLPAKLVEGGPCKTIGGCWGVTSKGAHANLKTFYYCMEEGTRIEGPLPDKCMVEGNPPLPRQLAYFLEKEVYRWQQTLFKLVQEEDDRWTHMIHDSRGGERGRTS